MATVGGNGNRCPAGEWGGLRGHNPSFPDKSHPLVRLTLQLSAWFLYLIPARKHLVTRHVFDNNLEHETGERTQDYLGAWAALKLLSCIAAIQTSHQRYKAWTESSLSSLDSLRLSWRNDFATDAFRKSFHKVTNGFWCKMGLVSIKSQSRVYWKLCGVTETDWLLHLADICQLFSNRTVLQLLGM